MRSFRDCVAIGVGCVAVLLVAGAPIAAQANDPFALSNQYQQPKSPVDLDLLPSPKKGEAKNKSEIDARIAFSIELQPKVARRGETVRYTITGNPKPGFHTYPSTQRADSDLQPEAGLTKLAPLPVAGLQPLWPIIESEPEWEEIKGLGWLLEYKKPFTISQDIYISNEAKPGKHEIRIMIKAQACDSSTCLWGEPEVVAELTISDASPIPPTSQDLKRLAEPRQPIRVLPIPTPVSEQKGAEGSAVTSPPEARPSLGGWLFISAAAAMAMLFTPCVFPMIPITVSFFLKQSEKEHHNALLTAAIYSFTIIFVLSATVLVLGEIIVTLANDPWLNLALGGLLVFFALSLFGMYELELPVGLANFTSSQQGRGGYYGVVFMALTFTITSFTCTGPFLGPMLGSLNEFKLSFVERALGALIYSATFASPFFVLALFPRLLKGLPKSGGWLNAVKVVMGFLELGAALKFLANTDIAWHPGRPMFFNYDTVLCGWIALSIACGFYLFGLYRLPHDSAVEYLGVPRMLLGGLFFGLALYMMPLLSRITPEGTVGRGLVAFLPPDTRQASRSASGGPSENGELTWLRSYEKAYEEALSQNKLIFVDFTGVTCTNCRYNEKIVFTIPNVNQSLSKYVRVQLYTDTVPDPALTADEAAAQAASNKELLRGTFHDITNPFYAIVRPDRTRPAVEQLPDGTKAMTGASRVLTRKGLIAENMISDFESFLNQPLKAQSEAKLASR